jgi:hypothetical protein
VGKGGRGKGGRKVERKKSSQQAGKEPNDKPGSLLKILEKSFVETLGICCVFVHLPVLKHEDWFGRCIHHC